MSPYCGIAVAVKQRSVCVARSTVFMVFCGLSFIVFSVGTAFESTKPCRAAIVARTAKASPGYIMKKLKERVSILLKLSRRVFMEFATHLTQSHCR